MCLGLLGTVVPFSALGALGALVGFAALGLLGFSCTLVGSFSLLLFAFGHSLRAWHECARGSLHSISLRSHIEPLRMCSVSVITRSSGTAPIRIGSEGRSNLE